MFVILTYDVNCKRVGKVLKLCRKYLYRVQNSVFEGKITEKRLGELKQGLVRLIDTQTDGVRIYRFNSVKYAKMELLGAVEKTDLIL